MTDLPPYQYLLGSLAAADAHGWRPISEAPKDGTPVLLLSKDGTQEVGRWWKDGTSWNEDCSALMKTGNWDAGGGWLEPQEVRAWMPLPPPPGSEPADAQQDTVRVPVEPTEAMLDAAKLALDNAYNGVKEEPDEGPVITEVYKAMLAAAKAGEEED